MVIDVLKFSLAYDRLKLSIAENFITLTYFYTILCSLATVYCETCITDLSDEMLRCQDCQSPNPTGFPKVCLALDHFLEEQFSEEYAQRRDAIQVGQIKVKPETTSGMYHLPTDF